MRAYGLLPVLMLVAAACGPDADSPAADGKTDPFWFRSERWDDGKAEVCVYEGRFKRYGKWRPARIRDYLIREYLDPAELTKRDAVIDGLVPVIKANRQVTFTTGTYDYRLMHTLFFLRDDGRLVKAVGTSQEGCGIAFSRWDRNDRRLRYDTYWEGEGAGSRPFEKKPGVLFADELGYRAVGLPDGAKVVVYPSLKRNRVGEFDGAPRTVERRGRRAVVRDEAGAETAEFVYDGDGLLERWTIRGEQEFRRVLKKRLYYWQFTDPGDEKRIEPK